MITKFEKRMIAVLLAALMCVPVSAIPVAQVNAEETQAVEPQEAISAEETQQGETDTAGADTAESTDTSDSSSAGASGEKAGMDVDDDGAFIPLEEEPQTPESEQAQEKQVQKEQAQEQQAQEQKAAQEDIQSAEKKADSDVPDAELPKIVLPANESQVRTETEFDGTTYSVRYIFQPDKTDTYFLHFPGNNGYGVWHKSGDDEEWLDSVEGMYELYEMQAGETYYIDIGGEEGVVSTSVWDFGKVEKIEPGSYDTEISNPGQVRYYSLSFRTSGIYWMKNTSEDYDWDMDIQVKQGTGSWWIYSDTQYKSMDQSNSCYVKVSHSDESWTGTISWGVGKAESTVVKVGQKITTYAESGVRNPLYSFSPEKDGEYVISRYWDMSVYDSEWNYMSDTNRMNLKAGETYYICISDGGNRKIEWQIEMVDVVKIQTDVEYERLKDQLVKYEFTPLESGRYHFQFDQGAYLQIDDGKSKYASDHWVSLEAGTTYEIGVSLASEQTETTWSVSKSVTKDIKEGADNTTAADESTEYRFAPGTSGNYLLTSSDLGKCEVYNSDGSIADAYCYQEETGFGANMYLEKGKTYYIHVIPKEENAVWKLEALKESGDFVYKTREDGTVEILKYTGTSAEVVIPEKIEDKIVASVGYGAFTDNETVTSVSVPGKVTAIQYGAFQSCVNLKSVKFAAGSELKSIGKIAFYECDNLESIEIPDQVESIGHWGFARSGLTAVTLPDSVTEVGAAVFGGCGNLKEAKLGKGLTKLNNSMFSGSGLEKMDIPDSVVSIGNNVFSGTNLSTIAIPDSVTEMGRSVFSNCDLLNSVTIGKGLKGIEDNMFNGCDALESINLPDNITYIGMLAFYHSGLTQIDIPDSVTSIGESAFARCAQLQKVNIGNGLAYVAQSAFSECDLTELVIGNKVQKIEIYAFTDNKNLKTVTIPNSVTEIEYSAFAGCESLIDIEIPDSVEAIGRNAFEGTAWYAAQAEGLVYAGKVLYTYKGDITEKDGVVTIVEGTKGIAENAFLNQKGLTKIVIPEGVTNIGRNAFTGCDSMTEITIPETVTRIDDCAVGYASLAERPMENFKIYGVKGSAAQTYAEENGFDFEAVEPSYIKGDVNGDGDVTIVDLRIVLRKVCGKIELESIQFLAADVEKDNKVDIQDLRKILRYVCKKIESFE